MIFNGTLYYKNSSDSLEVERIIVRDDHIAFQVMTTWGEHGKWSADGKAHKVDDEYHSGEIHSNQGNIEGMPCRISFKIITMNESELFLEGAWFENGELYEFNGELERMSLPNTNLTM